MNNNFLPIAINLENKKLLVVGAGKIALRKVLKLLNYTDNISVISEEFRSDFYDLEIELIEGSYSREILDNYDIVFACTSNEDLNLEIFKDCETKKLLCNNSSSQNEMSFKMLASFDYEKYTISISSDSLKDNVTLKNELQEALRKLKDCEINEID